VLKQLFICVENDRLMVYPIYLFAQVYAIWSYLNHHLLLIIMRTYV